MKHQAVCASVAAWARRRRLYHTQSNPQHVGADPRCNSISRPPNPRQLTLTLWARVDYPSDPNLRLGGRQCHL